MLEQLLIVGVLLGLIYFLVTNRFNPSLLFVGAAMAFAFAGMIPTQDLLNHYANETLVTLLLLLQVSTVVEKSSFIPQLTRKVFEGKSASLSVLRLSALSMLLSSCLNNTAIVASLIGVVKNNKHFSPSKLLIPLSYAAIMGGVITLIGTSTNLIVASFVIEAGLPEIQFFDFAFAGIPIALVGTGYLVFVLPRILPDNGNDNNIQEAAGYFLEAEVGEGSRLIGKTIQENDFRNLDNLFLAEIIRNDKLISPVTPDEVIRSGDTLVFTGDVARIQELRRFHGLKLLDNTDKILRSNLQEVVIKHNSPLIGQKIRKAKFRTKFDAAVVAVRRGDERLSGKIGQITLQTGDNLVLAVGKEFRRHNNLYRNFTLLNSIVTEESLNERESLISVGLFVLGIILAATGVVSLFKMLVVLMLLFLFLGYLRFRSLKNNLNFNLLLMIGSALAISQVLQDYGIADGLSKGLIQVVGPDSPYGSLIAIYLATVITTEIITNNAAAALLFPIALTTAQQLGVNPMPFIMAIAYGASASFLTPIGYQTNTMVYSVGKYRFSDYFKGGIWLSLLYAVMVVLLVPLFFPF
ncbi:MAG: SLC13 family permease [Bacteroidota bacterium]